MSSTTTPITPTPTGGPSAAGRRGGEPWRFGYQAAAGGALLAGAVLYSAGMLTAPPQASESTSDYLASFAAAPVLTQVSASLLHAGNLALGVGLLAVPSLPRARRGAVLTTVSALVSALVSLTLAGAVLYDFIALPMAQQLPVDQAASVFDAAHSSPFHAWFGLLMVAGLLAGVLVLVGLARAGVLRWWWALVPLAVTPVLAAVPFSPYLHGPLTVLGTLPTVAVALVLLRRSRVVAP